MLDGFLASNDLLRLQGAGTITAKEAELIANERDSEFDEQRKAMARDTVAGADDLEDLQRIAKAAKEDKGWKGGP